MTFPRVFSITELLSEIDRLKSGPCCAACTHIDMNATSTKADLKRCNLLLQDKRPGDGADCEYFDDASPVDTGASAAGTA